MCYNQFFSPDLIKILWDKPGEELEGQQEVEVDENSLDRIPGLFPTPVSSNG